MKIKELELLRDTLSFEEILEESDLTTDEVISVLYDLGYINIPTYLQKEYTDESINSKEEVRDVLQEIE